MSDRSSHDDRADRLAHELNNLLDGSMKSIELAVHRLRGSDLSEDQLAAVKRLEIADEILGRMAGVVEAWSASVAGSRDILEGVLDTRFGLGSGSGSIDDAFRHALASVPVSLETRGVLLSARADAGLAERPAGPLFNVIGNAVKNAAESIERRWHLADTPRGDGSGDRIAVTLMRDPDAAGWLELRVDDSGAGLDPAVTDAAGDVQIGVSTRAGGKGIGLAICRRIAADLGGTMSLTELDPRGVRFALRLPERSLPAASGGEAA